MSDTADAALLVAVRALVADAVGVTIEEVRAEALLIGYGIDSIRAVELLDQANERFDVTLDERDLQRFVTVADVARAIGARRAQRTRT